MKCNYAFTLSLSRVKWPMPRKPAPKAPLQARSRESLRRLLDAAEVVLEKHGVEGATLPRIAAVARLSTATVYRRFRDKDALMAAVFYRFIELNAQELAQKIDPEPLRKIGIHNFARQWIGALLQGYRTRTGLVRAAVLYSQHHADKAFVRRKEELEIESFHRMASRFLLWREEIRHPNPEYAVRFAMVMVAFALRELILFEQVHLFEKLLRLDDDRLEEELPRAFLRYLGVDGE
jgi:AcrR family transcriptional regulator